MNPYFTRNVAATAVNIIDGMELSANMEKISTAYEKRAMGFFEFSGWVADIAEQMNIDVDSRRAQEFPGVWDYEVAYPLGQWIIERIQHKGELPDEQVVLAVARDLTDKFFAQGEQA